MIQISCGSAWSGPGLRRVGPVTVAIRFTKHHFERLSTIDPKGIGVCPACGTRFPDSAVRDRTTQLRRPRPAVILSGLGALSLVAVVGGGIAGMDSDTSSTPSPATASPSRSPTGSSSSTASVAQQSEATSSSEASQRSEPFTGTWVGTVDQLGSRPYSVRLTLAWANGRLVGTRVYPGLSNCQVDLVNPRIEEAVLLVDEVIVVGKSNCIDTTLRLERSGDRLRYSFDGAYTGRAVLVAQAT